MKKAIIIGGSNGIGLASAKFLSERGFFVFIFDVREPAYEIEQSKYIFCDLRNFDIEMFNHYIDDEEVKILLLTAGIGRVVAFENMHQTEIEKTLKIDLIANIQILRAFYKRISSNQDFYCGVMGSIAGIVSSPLFSVYAAAKAGLFRFVESVNIELEKKGVNNRILNISPGALKGTAFYGGTNELSLLYSIVQTLFLKMKSRETLWIPEYENIYRGVIERYKADSHLYGLESYDYKIAGGRVQTKEKVIIGYLSGTFDLFHIGHLNLLQKAKKQCDYLIVGVHNSGAWKGKETFIPFEERKKIVAACKYVDKVVESCREDSEAWEKWHYNKLFVGSDYKGTERFERYEKYFADKLVEIVYFDYTQGTSSTQLREKLKR